MSKTPKLRFKEFSGDWEEQKLEDIADVIDGDRGINYPKEAEFYDDEYCLFLNAKNVTKNGFNFEENKFITQSKDSLLRKGKLKEEDIVLTTRGTVGNIAYFNKNIKYKNMRINSGMVLLRSKEIFSEYLYSYLKSDYFDKQVKRVCFGSAQPQLTVKGINNFKISYPSKEEQEKIASFFSLIDDKISLQSEKLEMLKDYKKGMMQKIFSRELRFKDDEGRDYPEWEEKKLAELLKSVSSGKTKSKNEIGEYKVYGSMGVIGYTDEKDYIGKHILIARVGANAGTVNIIDEPCGISDNTLAVKCNKDIDCKFLYYKLKQYNLSRLVFGSGQPLITGGQVKSITINVPNIDEQLKIARYMDIIEMKILKEQEKLDSLNEYKKGLLQQMFV